MAAETQYTANTGMVIISTANTNLDGTTGAYGTLLTGASNGTLVKSITIKAVTNTTQGMVRFFVYDNSSLTVLIEEVEIPTVTKSGTDSAFEQRLDLNFDLKATYVLKVSTENADTFHITAEGLDWDYYTESVRQESTNYTANTGGALITTANSSLTGGTLNTDIWIALTAGTTANGYNGCLIDSITVKALVDTTPGMVRLFVQNVSGSINTLLTEIEVPYVNQSATERSFVHQINFPGGFALQPGHKILASTQNSESFQVVIDAKDWKYAAGGGNIILGQNFTPVSGTAVTTLEKLRSYEIAAGLIQEGDILEVYSSWLVNNNANSKSYRIYVNTSDSLSGATLIAQANDTTSEAGSMQRFFPVRDDTTLEQFGGTGAVRSSYSNVTVASTTVSVPSVSAGFWILIASLKTNSGDTITLRWSMVRNNRL